MNIPEATGAYMAQAPEQRSALQHISLALRRNHITTLEQLRSIYREEPERLTLFRDIGPKRLALIGEMLHYYDTTVH